MLLARPTVVQLVALDHNDNIDSHEPTSLFHHKGFTCKCYCDNALMQIIFYFLSFEIIKCILRNRKESYARIHFLYKFKVFWLFFA